MSSANCIGIALNVESRCASRRWTRGEKPTQPQPPVFQQRAENFGLANHYTNDMIRAREDRSVSSQRLHDDTVERLFVLRGL
jgi:hypothetical protein